MNSISYMRYGPPQSSSVPFPSQPLNSMDDQTRCGCSGCGFLFPNSHNECLLSSVFTDETKSHSFGKAILEGVLELFGPNEEPTGKKEKYDTNLQEDGSIGGEFMDINQRAFTGWLSGKVEKQFREPECPVRRDPAYLEGGLNPDLEPLNEIMKKQKKLQARDGISYQEIAINSSVSFAKVVASSPPPTAPDPRLCISKPLAVGWVCPVSKWPLNKQLGSVYHTTHWLDSTPHPYYKLCSPAPGGPTQLGEWPSLSRTYSSNTNVGDPLSYFSKTFQQKATLALQSSFGTSTSSWKSALRASPRNYSRGSKVEEINNLFIYSKGHFK